ncbi:hypothetical protein F5051DRAFT_349554 [Lentinula edodes]|nr:hypothetical protein F5051DRAFT_349554 [Lentinula edodes]
MSNRDIPEPIKFFRFAELVQEIAKKSKAKSIAERKAAGKDQSKTWFPALSVFKAYSRNLQAGPPPPGTTSILFRFLFPEEDHKRKFGLRDKSLIRDIADSLGVTEDALCEQCDFAGCPGDHVYEFLLQRYSPDKDYRGNLDIVEVNELLNQLASTSPWSHVDYSKKTLSRNSTKSLLTRKDILKTLYRQMAPYEAAVLTQIILKDLRGLLYPQIERDPTAALKDYNTKAVKILTKENAMWAWDPSNSMNRSYRARWDLDVAAKAFESGQEVGPRIGTQIGVPKSQKGRSCKHALSFFSDFSQVWAETKYDGERAQIHVQVIHGQKPRITIFSKSKRDSTSDRRAIHAVILDSLGLNGRPGVEPRIKRSVVLDAEMVPCEGTRILEFWRIRRLIRETAAGVRGRGRDRGSRRWTGDNDTQEEEEEDQSDECVSESSLLSNTQGQHLGLVFFDIMYLDDESLLQTPYNLRREKLEELIIKEPGKAMLADRWLINLDEPSQNSPSDWSFDGNYTADDDEEMAYHREETADEDVNGGGTARRTLHDVFARRIAVGEEGLVLKAADSEYNEAKKPWVKLKKDYIEGLGDTVDLVLLGAACVPDRALELRVPPTTLTMFYIGAQTNKEETANNSEALPHFYIYFTAAYGLSRVELEGLNFLLKNDDPIRCTTKQSPRDGLEYTYTMYDKLARPELMLRKPIAVELYGDRFTVPEGSKQYELRWPRITKYFRRHERSWSDCMSLQELRKQAREAMGRVAAAEAARKDAETTFIHPNARSGRNAFVNVNHRPEGMRKRVEMWRTRVAAADRPKKNQGSGEKSSGSLVKQRKRERSVHNDFGNSPRKKRVVGNGNGGDNIIPSSLAGWCTTASSRLLLLSEVPGRCVQMETSVMLDNSLAGISDDQIVPPVVGTIPGNTVDIVIPLVEHLASEDQGVPLQNATNMIQFAIQEDSHSKSSSSSNDENSQPSAPNPPTPSLAKTHFSQLESLRSKRKQYPSPPTSPVHSKRSDERVSSVDLFFKDALFWVPSLKDRQHGLPSVRSIVESGSRANGLEAFLGACRWNPRKYNPVKPPPTRGIVFVDLEDEWGSRWKRNVVDGIRYLERQWTCTDEPRVPIWIFDRRTVFQAGKDVGSQALAAFK